MPYCEPYSPKIPIANDHDRNQADGAREALRKASGFLRFAQTELANAIACEHVDANAIAPPANYLQALSEALDAMIGDDFDPIKRLLGEEIEEYEADQACRECADPVARRMAGFGGGP